MIWLVLQSHRAHSSVICCSNLLPDIPGSLLSPTITWTPLFLLLCYLRHAKFGFNFQKLLPGGPALEASLGGSISSLLRDRMSPLFQTSLLQALALTDIWSMPNPPSQCQFWLRLSCRVFPSHALPVAPLLASTSPPPAASSSIHKHTRACAFINVFLILCSSCLHYILSLS